MNRKTRRAIKKSKNKQVYEAARQVENAISNIPKSCYKCKVAFDMTNKEQISDWQIDVYHDTSIRLCCPECITFK